MLATIPDPVDQDLCAVILKGREHKDNEIQVSSIRFFNSLAAEYVGNPAQFVLALMQLIFGLTQLVLRITFLLYAILREGIRLLDAGYQPLLSRVFFFCNRT